MRIVLDTSVLVGADMSSLVGTAAVSVVGLAELHLGISVATDPVEGSARLGRLSVIEATFAALPADEAVARSYAVLAAAVSRTGRPPRSRAFDPLIAATAHANGAAIATRKAADLRGRNCSRLSVCEHVRAIQVSSL